MMKTEDIQRGIRQVMDRDSTTVKPEPVATRGVTATLQKR